MTLHKVLTLAEAIEVLNEASYAATYLALKANDPRASKLRSMALDSDALCAEQDALADRIEREMVRIGDDERPYLDAQQ